MLRPFSILRMPVLVLSPCGKQGNFVFKVTFSKENKHALHDHRKNLLTNTRVSALLNVTPLNTLGEVGI